MLISADTPAWQGTAVDNGNPGSGDKFGLRAPNPGGTSILDPTFSAISGDIFSLTFGRRL
jgi:hypothetical protein